MRKNGNTSNDFSATSLNTRPVSSNNYANQLGIGQNSSVNLQRIDDLLWRSDASSVPWVGDIRCYTRMPASDASVQFTRLGGATMPAVLSETQQDGATSYVFDANVGDADFYTVGTIASTPALVVAVTTRGFLQKSDAGAKGAAVQIKSGGTTVASTATLLSSSFGWLWRTDTLDPATGTAWTATGVNNAQIGPIVTLMTDVRLTQEAIEQWARSTPNAQLTQIGLGAVGVHHDCPAQVALTRLRSSNGRPRYRLCATAPSSR